MNKYDRKVKRFVKKYIGNARKIRKRITDEDIEWAKSEINKIEGESNDAPNKKNQLDIVSQMVR